MYANAQYTMPNAQCALHMVKYKFRHFQQEMGVLKSVKVDAQYPQNVLHWQVGVPSIPFKPIDPGL